MPKENSSFQISETEAGHLQFAMPTTLDSVSVPKIKPQGLASLSKAAVGLDVDLTATTFMDSAGVGLLVTLYRTTKELDLPMVLVGAKGQPLSLIESLQIEKVIPLK